MNPYLATARGLSTIRPSGGSGLTPTERQSLLTQLANETGQTIEVVARYLDTAGGIARGVLAGDPLSGFSSDPERRVSGEELLDTFGIKPENPYASGVAGFAAEVLTDPLAYISGPLTAYSKAGRVAKGIGLLDNAPQVAQKLTTARTMTRAFTEDALKAARVPIGSAAQQTARPLYGQRYAQATLTLEDLVNNSADVNAARRAAQQFISKNFGPYATYAEISKQKLGGTVGIGLPFGPSEAVFNPFGQQGSERVADALDLAGQAIAWSGPMRYASSLFDKRVGGETTVGGQIQAMRQSQLLDNATAVADAKSTQFITKLSKLRIPQQIQATTGVRSLFSVSGNEALTRIIEGVPSQSDTQLLAQVPGLQQWVNEWKQYAADRLQRSADVGLPASALNDPSGLEYLSRYGDEIRRDPLDRTAGAGGTYQGKTSNNMARVDALKNLPGGADTIRQISSDPRVRAYARAGLESQENDRQIAQHIEGLVQRITGRQIPPEKADRIARIMRDINPDLPDNVPLFSAHPANSITRYMTSSERALATVDAAFEALADNVVNMEYTRIPGGRHFTLGEAIQRMSGAVGLEAPPAGVRGAAETQIRNRVAARLGIRPDDVNLSLMSVPESIVQRLTRINEFYATPAAQGQIRKLMDGLTTVFKSFVLAFPSRYTRDIYSGGFQNWLENGSWSDTVRGMYAASNVIAGKYQNALFELRLVPRYAGKTDQQIIDMFLEDAGSNGALRGLSTADFSSANRTAESLNQLVPGLSPIMMSESLREFAPQQGRTWTQFAKDFGTIRGFNTTYETKNPILRWGEKMNDASDSINRLGGFIALLKQGVEPAQAAKRVLASQVDYSSLTPFERNVMRFIFPWWAYNSRMGKFVVQHLMERPGGRFGQTIRGINDATASNEEGYVPTQLRQQFAFRDPSEAFFPPTGDTKRYIVGLDIPGADILNTVRMSSTPGFMNALSDTVSMTTGELFNQMNPVFRSTAELATGTDLFSKRPLEESYTPADRIYQAVTGRQDKLTPLTKTVVANIPGIQRALGVGSVIADQRLTPAERGLKLGVNTTMGFRMASTDPEQELLDVIAKTSKRNAPWQRSFEVQYIPDELQQYMPPAARKLNMLQEETRKQLRRRWVAEAKGQPKQKTGTTNTPTPMFR